MPNPSYEYYGLMATFWDLFRGDTSNWEDRFFFLDVVKKYGSPVLDVGCGTGRILLDFMAQGFDIDGVDNSPDMLAMLKQKADEQKLSPHYYQQDVTDLSLPRKYQTILVPSSSFQLLLEPSQPSRVMQNFFEHLLPGGVLAMPFMTLWKEGDPLESDDAREIIRPEDGATIRRWSHSRFDPQTNFEHTMDRYEIVNNGEVVTSEEHIQSPATLSYTQQHALALYEKAGFKNVQIFHGFTFEPVQPDEMLFSVLGFKP